jgi:hypothetical protein
MKFGLNKSIDYEIKGGHLYDDENVLQKEVDNIL